MSNVDQACYDRFASEVLGSDVINVQFLGEDGFTVNLDTFSGKLGNCVVVCRSRFPISDLNLLRRNNFVFAGAISSLKYRRDVSGSIVPRDSVGGFRLVSGADVSSWGKAGWLNEFARDLASVSHYSGSPFFNEKFSCDLYMKWVKNALGKRSDKIFVAFAEGPSGISDCAGFISLCRKKDNSLSIDLVSTRKKYRGLGCAGLLVSEVVTYALSSDLELTVRTQVNNPAALRLYQKYGFVIEETEFIYHGSIGKPLD